MRAWIVFSLLFLTLPLAQAGDKARNGGTVIQCRNSYEVLDLYEGRELHGLTLDIPSGDEIQIVGQLLSRIRSYEPSRADLYSRYLESFYREARFVREKLTPIDDLGEGVVIPPQDCAILQVVSQARQVNAVGARYVIDKTIWDQLNSANRAALILHEIIYRELYAQNQIIKTSQGLRYYSALIFSSEITTLSSQQYVSAIRGTGLQTVEYRGYTLLLHSGSSFAGQVNYDVEFFADGSVHRGFLGHRLTLSEGQPQISCVEGEKDSSAGIAIKFEHEDKSAILSSSCLMYLRKQSPSASWSIYTQTIFLTPEKKVAYAALTSTMIGVYKLPALKFIGKSYYITSYLKNGTVSFWDNGQARSIELFWTRAAAEDLVILYKKTHFSFETQSASIEIHFDEDGNDISENWAL